MSDMTDITISELPVVVRDGEPRALDTDIGERLGLARPTNIRPLIEDNMAELLRFGDVARVPCNVPMPRGGFKEGFAYYLNEEQALLVSTISKAPKAPDVRAMLIRTFVAWRRGHLPSELPPDIAEMLRRTDGICRMMIGKVTGMEKALPALAAQIAGEMLPIMLKAEMASQNFAIRRGKTAGQIWKEAGFPKLKITSWFSNRLTEMKCEIEGGGRGELGLSNAKLFCPDKAATWLKNGGRLIVETKIAERQGQRVLRLVPKVVAEAPPTL